jgi:hypothetical protein
MALDEEARLERNRKVREYYYANREKKIAGDLGRYYKKKAQSLGIEVEDNCTLNEVKRKVIAHKLMTLL